MYATTYSADAITDAAAETAPCEGFFARFMMALSETQTQRARIVIASHAHLFSDGQEATDVMPGRTR